MNITLTVIEGPQEGKKFEFSEPDNFLPGCDHSGSNAHFRLNNCDTQVSLNHFILKINPPDCFIRDAGSNKCDYRNFVLPDSERVDELLEAAHRFIDEIDTALSVQNTPVS
jgi:hypothetical protein